MRAALHVFLHVVATTASAAPLLTAATAPNFVYIMSDDLGFGEVSWTPGRTNTNISTPRIDALAASGMRFLSAYTGSPVCAPSRGALLTGLHTGHATIRGTANDGSGELPLLANPADRTFLMALRDAGYEVACVGKWGVGEVGSVADPVSKGCSTYFGGVDQSDVHDMYPSQPDFTWRYPAANGSLVYEGIAYPENIGASRATCMAAGSNCTWAHDLWTNAALAALDAHAARVAARGAAAAPPLFLYVAYTDPHAGGWDGTVEVGNPVPSDGRFATEPWPIVERDHASVIENFQDRDVGRLVDAVAAHGLTENTAIFFASDNGASNEGGHDYAFFDSSGPLRGFKRCLTEGGIRTPLVVAWPGTVPAGVASTFPTAFWDQGNTILELAGVPAGNWLAGDGRSIADVLRSPSGAPPSSAPLRAPLYWEFCTSVHPPLEPRSGKGWGHAVVNGTMKLVSFFEDQAPRLYNLSEDVYETHDIAANYSALVAAMSAYATAQHVDSTVFPVANCLAS